LTLVVGAARVRHRPEIGLLVAALAPELLDRIVGQSPEAPDPATELPADLAPVPRREQERQTGTHRGAQQEPLEAARPLALNHDHVLFVSRHDVSLVLKSGSRYSPASASSTARTAGL